MTISNELSSEIAAALLTINDRSPDELSNLKDIVIHVHSTLQQMDLETREDLSDMGTDRARASDP
jgi:hypothetical protein